MERRPFEYILKALALITVIQILLANINHANAHITYIEVKYPLKVSL